MRFLADENFNGRILAGLLKRNPDLDVVRAQDTAIYEADDPVVLEYAGKEGRILLTHDAQTMPDFAYERIGDGLPMPGMIVVPEKVSIAKAIDDILTIIGASDPKEWVDQVKRLPL